MESIKDIRNFRNGGMDIDSSPESVDQNDYISAYNIRITGSTEGEDGYVTNIESTDAISSTLPDGINKCIGTESFESIEKAYSFLYNSNKRHQLREFDYNTQIETVLFENITHSGGEDILPLDPRIYIKDIKLINDIFLSFVADNINPCYINLQRLKNGSYGTIRKEDLWLIKPQILTPPTTRFENDSTRSVNLLSQRIFQFTAQGRFLDDELSAWSTYSKRSVPEDESTPAIGTDVTKYNTLIVTTDIGNDRIKELNIASRYDMLDWSLVKTVTREHILSLTHTEVDIAQEVYEAYNPTDNTYSFAFYNDGIYTPVDPLETDLFADAVPEKAGALEVINGNIIALADITEGKTRPTTRVSLSSTSYDPQIDITVPDNVNKLQVTYTQNRRIGGSHRRACDVGYNGDPKTGDKMVIRVGNLDNNDFIDYEYTVTPSEENNLQAAVKKMSEQVPSASIYELNGGWAIRFSTSAYYELKSAYITLANAGSGEAKSIHSVKSNSAYQASLSYRDAFGRPFPLRTDDSFIVKTLSFSQAQGLIPKINWEILDENAPEGAVDYQWLLTKNNTHETTLYVDCKVYETLTDYIVLDLNPLKRFNNTNSSSVLNYEYTKGDRCTFHYYEDSGKQWYDGQSRPSVDVEVVGFELRSIPDTEGTPENEADIKWLLKVRKSPSINIPTITGKTIVVEVYTPRKRTETVDNETSLVDTVFYEIGERYTITNGKHDVLSGVIKEADSYFKSRQIVDAIDDSTVITLLVEDFNFSDFYISNYTSYGRVRTYFDVKEKSRRKASIRYSDSFILGSKNNGLTRFYDTRIYGEGDGESSSSYGAIIKIRQRGNVLVVLQELLVGYIPVFTSIVEDQAAQEQTYLSDKLLNKIRYNNSVNIGIGNAKESYAEFGANIFFIDPFRSEPIRAGLDGIFPISHKMSKWFKRVIQRAYKQGKKIIGWYDVFNKEYVVSIETDGDVLISFKFDSAQWKYEDDYTILPSGISITTAPTKGTVSYNSTTGKAIYTPNNGQTGSDFFQFSFTVNSQVITKRECITIIPGQKDVNAFSFVDVTNADINTQYISNSILVFGNNIPVSASVSGGEMSINEGSWTTASTLVSEGDTIRVRRTSSGSYNTLTSVTLTVSDKSDSFDITTKIAYYNQVQSQDFTRNNCAVGLVGTTVTYTVPAGTYVSYVSLVDANNMALQDIADNGQNYANTNGLCEPPEYPFKWVADTTTLQCEKEAVEERVVTGFHSPEGGVVIGSNIYFYDVNLNAVIYGNPDTITTGADMSIIALPALARPCAMFYHQPTNKLYVNTFNAGGMAVIDVTTNTFSHVVPYGIDGSFSRGNIYYIGLLNEIWGLGNSGFVRFTPETEVQISGSFTASGAVWIGEYNNKIYVLQDGASNEIRIYDTTLTQTGTISGICANNGVSGTKIARGYYLDAINGMLYIGEASTTGGVVVVNLNTNLVVSRIEFDKEGFTYVVPQTMGINPITNKLFVVGTIYNVTTSLNPRVWVFDVASITVTETIVPSIATAIINDCIYYSASNSFYLGSRGTYDPGTDGVLFEIGFSGSVNTGYQLIIDLLKVVNSPGSPNDGLPLDVNNNLTSISGLPQDEKANNAADPDYKPKVLNTTSCPI